MANIYVDNKKHLEEQYKDQQTRNKRAKELRQEGWSVTCKKWDFAGLGGEAIYAIEASKEQGRN